MLKVNDITIHFKSQAEGSCFAAVGTIDSHFWFLAHHVDEVGSSSNMRPHRAETACLVALP